MDVDLEYNYEETTSVMDKFSQSDIDEIKQWTQTLDETKQVPKNLTNKQIVLFYNSCYADMEKTKQCIENYYSCRKNAPELFNNRTLTEQDKETLQVIRITILPGKSCQGDDIVYYSIFEDDYSKFNLESAAKLMFMTVDLYLSTQGPQSGYMFVIDTRGIRFMHLTRISIFLLRKCFQYLQAAMPVRLHSIHMINVNPIVDKVLLLIKPFLDKKFIDMIHFHKKGEDLEVLYKLIPKSALPSNFGGDLPDLNTLHEENIKRLQLLETYFKAEEEQRTKASSQGNEK